MLIDSPLCHMWMCWCVCARCVYAHRCSSHICRVSCANSNIHLIYGTMKFTIYLSLDTLTLSHTTHTHTQAPIPLRPFKRSRIYVHTHTNTRTHHIYRKSKQRVIWEVRTASSIWLKPIKANKIRYTKFFIFIFFDTVLFVLSVIFDWFKTDESETKAHLTFVQTSEIVNINGIRYS